jgi:hypothetical protein
MNINIEDVTSYPPEKKAPLQKAYKGPGIAQISMIFSLTIALFIFIAYRVQKRELYSGLLITEFSLIMLPALLYLLITKCNIKEYIRINYTKPLNFLIVFCIMLFAMPLATIFNFINLFAVNSIFGKVVSSQIPVGENGLSLLISIAVIAGSAGICEEFLFRGVIQRGLERLGAAGSILFAALLFSLTHMDFQKILGTFILGVLLGFIVYKTNSVFCGMFAHFTNNALAVLLNYAAKKMSGVRGTEMNMTTNSVDLNGMIETLSSLPAESRIIVFCTFGFIFLFIAAIFVLLLHTFIRINSGERKNAIVKDDAETAITDEIHVRRSEKVGLLWLTPGVILIAVMFIYEVFRFTDSNNVFINILSKLLGIG